LTFYNSSSADQTIPAGTVFTDSNGVQFVNDVDAVIPAGNPPTAAQVTVSAHAVIGGENGNIPAFDFNNVPCCATGVFVLNTSAFSGGQNAQIFTYVQQADIDTAVSALEASVMTNVQTALQKQIHTNEQLVSPVQCGTNVNSDHSAGDHASNVTVNTMVVCTAEVYDQQAVQLIAQEMLKTDPTEYPGNGYVPVGTIVTTVTKATADAKGVISLLVNVEGVWVYQFGDAQKQEFAKLIAGKNQKEAQSLLMQQPGVDITTFQFFGGDGNTLPKNQSRISIAVLSVPGLQGVGTPTITPASHTVIPQATPSRTS
jgi:Baseplate J-like protein